MTDKELYKLAEKAMENAYAPYSGFTVGAAVLTNEGQVYTGCNIENAAYGVSLCAERVAISNAISNGTKNFKAIAIVSNEGYAFPCGTCRQFMFEFGDNIKVIVGSNGDNLEIHTVKELLPNGFRMENNQ